MPVRARRGRSNALRSRLIAVLVATVIALDGSAHGPLSSSAAAVGGCYGAAAMAVGKTCPPPTRAPNVPDPATARRDSSDAWRRVGRADCFAHAPAFPLVVCHRGVDPRTAVGHIAVVGNSHAGHWLSAIELIAAKHRWTVTTYLASGCASADLDQHWSDAATIAACRTWARRATYYAAHGSYGLVIVADKVYSAAEGYDLAHSWAQYRLGYERVLRQFARQHQRVLGIRETPVPRIDIPACLRVHPSDFRPCNGTPGRWLPPEPMTAAMIAQHDPRMAMADLTRYFCTTTVCPAAIGTVPVYFDGSHLTATYAASVAPYLDPLVMRSLRG